MKRRIVFLISLFLYLSFFVIIVAHAKNHEDLRIEISRKERDIESINREIEEKKKDIEILNKRKFSILDELHNLEIRLEKGKEGLKRLERQQRMTDRNIREVEKELKSLKDRRSVIENALKERLVAIYKSRQGGSLKVIFSTDSLDNLGRNLRYIKLLVNHDLLFLNEYKKNQIRLEERKERLDNYRIELDILSKEYIVKSRELTHQKDKKQSLIKEIEKEKDLQLAVLKEFEKRSVKLQSLIERLRKDIKEGEIGKQDIDFASMRGKLDMPVDGEVISLYGTVKHPRFKTVTFNKGIEIRTHAGAEVRSVFKGEVVYAGWFKGYGKMMIIDHGGGYYTLFAHLAKNLKDVGGKVENGEVMALAGDTGSLNGPMLYFEVRFHGVPKDPLEWIAQK